MMEQQADQLDVAAANTENNTQHAIAAVRSKLNSHAVSADDCVECGEQIPSARQLAVVGCQHCIGCAQALEQGSKQYA